MSRTLYPDLCCASHADSSDVGLYSKSVASVPWPLRSGYDPGFVEHVVIKQLAVRVLDLLEIYWLQVVSSKHNVDEMNQIARLRSRREMGLMWQKLSTYIGVPLLKA